LIPSKSIPEVRIQFRPLRKQEGTRWFDIGREDFVVFEHERHLAEEYVAELNKCSKHYEYRVKPDKDHP
jgi:hypothetical protein